MVPLNLVLRGGTHPSRPRGSGDQRALIRRENIFPRRYRVFQANCSNTTIDYTCTFTGAKRSLSLSLSLHSSSTIFWRRTSVEKKRERRGLTPIRRRTMGENRIAQRVWKRPIPWQMKARYEHTYIYTVCTRRRCNFLPNFQPTSSESLRLLQFFRAISIREPQEFAISKEKKRKETDSSIYSRLFRDNLRDRATDNHTRPPMIIDKSARARKANEQKKEEAAARVKKVIFLSSNTS